SLLTLSVVGVGATAAQATEVPAEGNYATWAACDADGRDGSFEQNHRWVSYDCRQGNDGLWYLYLQD
ncbi:hypothetical protein ACW9HQ_43730, partial [Nocardia gipuzkoensis]